MVFIRVFKDFSGRRHLWNSHCWAKTSNRIQLAGEDLNGIHLTAHDLAKLDLWYAARVRWVKSPAVESMMMMMRRTMMVK